MLALKKKIITQVYVERENFSFTFFDAEDYAASEKMAKNICMYFKLLLYF